MKKTSTDIAIFGAGIAGLWLFHHLRKAGYDAVLLEIDAIGGGQTIASQGILHSGLKYTMAGKVNALARSISAMPDIWRAALRGEGPVDLSAAKIAAPSQQLLIPGGLIGGIVKTLSQKMLGDSVHEISQDNWPKELVEAGFNGSVVNMNELVLDIPSVIRALAEPYRDHIFKIENTEDALAQLDAKLTIFTAAGSNAQIAKKSLHSKGLEVQTRPLLMGMIRHAPFPLYAHLVGNSDKPVATITTHRAQTGDLIWYLGAAVAERAKDSAPEEVHDATIKAFAKYFPNLDISAFEWSTLPIDRVEGKSNTDNWMPDTPTIHETRNHLYCWPTKLTFAPMLTDMVIEKINNKGVNPSKKSIVDAPWPQADYATPFWDKSTWTTHK